MNGWVILSYRLVYICITLHVRRVNDIPGSCKPASKKVRSSIIERNLLMHKTVAVLGVFLAKNDAHVSASHYQDAYQNK